MMQPFLSESQFNIMFKNSKDMVFFMKKKGEDFEYLYINTKARHLFNIAPCGKTVSEIMSKNLAETILHYYNLAIETKEQQNYQDYDYYKNEVRKHETTVFPIFANNEVFILGIAKEITFDRDLQDKYLFMRSIFFKTFLSTVLISNDLKFLEANERFIDDFGICLESMQGQSFLSLPLIQGPYVSEWKSYLTDAQNGDNFTTKIVKFIDKENKTRSFTATFSPLASTNGDVLAIFLILQEVTDFIEQQKELRETSHGLAIIKNAINNAVELSIIDDDRKIIDLNDRFVARTGYTREELIGQTHDILDSGYHPPDFGEKMWEKLRRGEIWQGEICNRSKQGELYWVDTTIIPLTNAAGEIDSYFSVNYNTSEKKRLMIELQNSERTFRIITENMNDFIVIMDENGMIQYVSPSYVRTFKYTEEELIGKNYSSFLTEESETTWLSALKNMERHEMTIELALQTKKGDVIWTEGKYKAAKDDRIEHAYQIIMVSREITERKKLENSLRFMAYHDNLTQLPNRRYLEKEFPRVLNTAKKNNRSIAVLYIDGDNFKEINDQYGHDVGDAFIKLTGERIASSIRESDFVVRIGGDEFVAVLANLSIIEKERKKVIQDIIERVKYNLQLGADIQGYHFKPTVSIGVSYYPDHAATLETLLENADKALYKAKTVEKNGFKIYDDVQ
ncbi:diguanylate cyclase domain-containing protein [Metasolibacillus meyeri]|uniref:sensor domain-containing diguanylate cyclase n=1 Tax=Metasolibacillus meyeri TaxID=1071052 RepID=UPI00187D2CD0|nr:diguanylate cyclase [Metasolibacillus meyeri]